MSKTQQAQEPAKAKKKSKVKKSKGMKIRRSARKQRQLHRLTKA